MVMKVSRIAWTCTALVLASLARAEAPAVNPQSLAMAEAVASVCADLDPGAAERYLALPLLLARTLSSEALATLRQSDDYAAAQAAALEMLRTVPASEARETCSSSLAASR